MNRQYRLIPDAEYKQREEELGPKIVFYNVKIETNTLRGFGNANSLHGGIIYLNLRDVEIALGLPPKLEARIL